MRFRPTTPYVLAAALVLALFVGAGIYLSLDEDESGPSLSGSVAPAGVKPATDGSLTASETPKSADGTDTRVADDGTVVSGSGGGSGSAGSGSGGGASGAGGAATPETGGMNVKLLWWNDTVNRPPSDFEVAFAGSSFSPDPDETRDSGLIGPCTYGKPLQLMVYPEGRGSESSPNKPLVVRFVVTKGMEENSDADAIHIEVSDEGIKVLGNAVENFQKDFNR